MRDRNILLLTVSCGALSHRDVMEALISSQAMPTLCPGVQQPERPVIVITEREYMDDMVQKLAVSFTSDDYAQELDVYSLRKTSRERACPNEPWYRKFDKRRKR